MGVRDRGNPADIIVGNVEEGGRCDAHQRTVAIVPFAGQPPTGADGHEACAAHVEDAVVRSVFSVVQPVAVSVQQIVGVDIPVMIQQRVKRGERHGGVVAPCAGRLIMRAVADHRAAMKCAAHLELVRHAQRIRDGKAVQHRFELPSRVFHVALLVYFLHVSQHCATTS